MSDSTEADGAVTGDSPNSGKSVQQRLNEIGRMMAMNLAFQLATLAAFGILIYVVQQGRQRGISGPGVSSGDETLMAIQAPTPVTSSPNLWPDLDEPAVTVSAPVAVPGADLPRASAANFPLPQSVDALNDGTAADELRDESSAPVVTFERWHFPTELRWAFEVFLVALLPTFILRLVLVWVLDDPAQHPLLELMTEGVPWSIMAMIAVMAVVVAPLAEELQYRVIVLGGLAQTGTVLTGWIVSSLLFAFAHNFPDSIALLPLAFAIGYAYIRRRSYRTVALIHFLFNGFNMLLAMLTLP